jgi:hypothetical protein
MTSLSSHEAIFQHSTRYQERRRKGKLQWRFLYVHSRSQLPDTGRLTQLQSAQNQTPESRSLRSKSLRIACAFTVSLDHVFYTGKFFFAAQQPLELALRPASRGVRPGFQSVVELVEANANGLLLSFCPKARPTSCWSQNPTGHLSSF